MRWFKPDPEYRGKKVSAWIHETEDPSAHVRVKAAVALGEIRPVPEAAVARLVGLLEDEDWLIRESAAESLSRIGVLAVPALVEARERGSWSTRQAASRALSKIREGAD